MFCFAFFICFSGKNNILCIIYIKCQSNFEKEIFVRMTVIELGCLDLGIYILYISLELFCWWLKLITNTSDTSVKLRRVYAWSWYRSVFICCNDTSHPSLSSIQDLVPVRYKDQFKVAFVNKLTFGYIGVFVFFFNLNQI